MCLSNLAELLDLIDTNLKSIINGPLIKYDFRKTPRHIFASCLRHNDVLHKDVYHEVNYTKIT